MTWAGLQTGGNPNTPIYGLSDGACGYGDIPRTSWPFWQVGALGFGNSISASNLPQKWGCGACVEVTCEGPVRASAPVNSIRSLAAKGNAKGNVKDNPPGALVSYLCELAKMACRLQLLHGRPQRSADISLYGPRESDLLHAKLQGCSNACTAQ